VPKNVAQWTGITVTAIIVLGCDLDVLRALPFGIFAGVLAALFVTLAEKRPLGRIRLRWPRRRTHSVPIKP